MVSKNYKKAPRYTGKETMPEISEERPNIKELLVPPGERFTFDDVDPNNTMFLTRPSGIKILRENIQINQKYQAQLYAEHQRSLLVIVQGMNTSGKSTCMKRVLTSMDPAGIQVTHFEEPSELEKAHDFLWRIHAKIPPKGYIGTWIRSHYEDVTTARVIGELTQQEWKTRYEMINAFEKILALNGTKIVKVFLHISDDEQLSRLGMNALLPLKAWNVRPEDFDQRVHWLEYMESWEDALSSTSTDYAPWYVIPSNEKWVRNALVSEVIHQALRQMQPEYPGKVFNAYRLVKRMKKQYAAEGLIGSKTVRKKKVK